MRELICTASGRETPAIGCYTSLMKTSWSLHGLGHLSHVYRHEAPNMKGRRYVYPRFGSKTRVKPGIIGVDPIYPIMSTASRRQFMPFESSSEDLV